jgi:hypothetical protein
MSEPRAKGGLPLSEVLGYLVCAIFVALVADIVPPQEPFVFSLAVVFVVAAMVPPTQDLQRWILAGAKERGTRNPEVATAPVPPPSPVEIPAAPPLERLQTATAGTDQLERAIADLRLRLLGLGLFALRRLASLWTDAKPALIATGAGEAFGFASALQAGGLTLKSVNEASGAVSGGLCGITGAINLANMVISGHCRVGQDDCTVTMVLTSADSYRLVGEATHDAGHKPPAIR